MRWTVPERNSRLRWAVIICGVVIFLWMSPEDNHIWPVAMLGTVAALLLVLWWTLGRFGGQHINAGALLTMGAVSGLITGASGAVITAILMLLKNARHSHFFPDFPPEQIIAMLERAPLWGIAGSFAGLGMSLLLVSVKREPTTGTLTHTEEPDSSAV